MYIFKLPFLKPQKWHQRAFTLIEMLVVLVIIAIMISTAVISFSSRADVRQLRMTADNLTKAIGMAKAQSILLPAIIGIDISCHHYQFYRFYLDNDAQNGHWAQMHDWGFSAPFAFPSGVRVAVVKSDHPVFQKAPNMPELIFYPNGVVRPITLKIFHHDNRAVYHLHLSENGTTQLEHLS